MFTTVRFATTLALAAGGLVATAATASAQVGPPGACACEAPAPAVIVEAPPSLPRWGVGLHATSLGLAPENAPDAQTEYGGGGLHVTYRVAPRWQLELSLDHVTERLENGDDGTLELQSATLAARYHFNPYARWDWYVLAGIGATSDGNPDLSDEQRRATQRGHVHLGGGVERRFGRDGRFGLAAELRAVGIAPAEVQDAPVTEPSRPMPTEALPPAVPTSVIDAQGASGGQLTIAATYYF